ncbi:MAG: hypothetical protein PHN88_04105 [Ignavibacteria bacterium]|nr:hypothetical protein [Ignavibacteria bacterium]
MKDDFLKERIIDISAILLIIGAAFLMFHNLIMGEVIASSDVGTNDLWYLYFPNRFLYGEALKAGQILQWTPYIFSGYPVFAEGQSGFLYPLNLIMCYLLDPIPAMNWFIIVHSIIAGIGSYFFAKKISGSGSWAIPIGVAAAICGALTTGHIRQMNVYAIISLMPWLFLFAESFAKKQKLSSAMLYGSVLGLMLVTNHPQFSFICGFISLLYLYLRFYFGEKKFSEYYKSISLFLGAAIVISLLIGFYQLKETYLLSTFSIRSQEALSPGYTGMGSLAWGGLMTFFYPYYSGNAGTNTYSIPETYMFWESFHYISLVLILIAIIGIIKSFKTNQYVKIFLIIAGISFLFALGENIKLYRIFSFFPVIKAFRFPLRWLIGTEFSLLFVSVFGVKYLFDMIFAGKKIKQEPIKQGKQKVKTQAVEKVVPNEQEIQRKHYFAGLALAVIVILDIYLMTGSGVTTADRSIFFPSENGTINYIKTGGFRRVFTMGEVELGSNIYRLSRGWEGDKSMYKIMAGMLPPNLPSCFHIMSTGGYINLCPHYVYEVWGDQDHSGIIRKSVSSKDNKTIILSPQFVKLAKMWGVKDYLSIFNLTEPLVKRSDSLGVKHYELSDVMPRAWVVKDIISTPEDNKNSAEMLLDNNFNPAEKAIVNGNAPEMPVNSANSNADIVQDGNHLVKIKASAPGLVVLSDTWYPKWKARVNGTEVPVYRVNNSMRGVVSPAAGSEVEFYYDEGNIKIFLLLSLVTLLGVCVFGVYDYKKDKR